MRKKLSSLLLGILVMTVTAAAVYAGLSLAGRPAFKTGAAAFLPAVARKEEGQVIDSSTVVREEYEYLCGDVHIIYLGRAPQSLVGAGRQALLEKYPPEEGWTQETVAGTVVFRKQCRDFCPEHKNFRHLGISEGFLAVFEGPLGNNQKLLRVEKNIPVSSLSPDFQTRLEQAMDFGRQLPEIQVQLRRELEFNGESALNAGLENIDEHLVENKSP
jgi:hypothetical protein